MAHFFVALWESVFQPGTSPQLIIATHISFLLLLTVLGSQIYLTNNVHYYALFTIATLLWITVTWFVSELNQVKLQDNKELESKFGKTTATAASSKAPEEKKESAPVTSTSTNRRTRSRKL